MTKEKPKKKVIVRLILEAEKEIKKELKIINKDIKDFTTRVPIPSIINIKKRDDYFKERLTGRLSTDNLRKNYEKKLI